jgi:eukaryotic-like serine/threonine-protein kinase
LLFSVLRYVLTGLVLLLVFLASALVAMRYAIRGREVSVPALSGLTRTEAERSANATGLVLSIESHFYSPVLQGRIVSQVPEAGARVRRGWRIMAAESLGPQRAAVPNVIGQSQHAADINITRHGLEIGSVATMRSPGSQPGTVLAQSPSPDNKEAPSPKVDLLLAAPDSAQLYVMPSFAGKPLAEASEILRHAGFTVGKISPAAVDTQQRGPGIIVRQYPAPGQRAAGGTAVNFDVSQ